MDCGRPDTLFTDRGIATFATAAVLATAMTLVLNSQTVRDDEMPRATAMTVIWLDTSIPYGAVAGPGEGLGERNERSTHTLTSAEPAMPVELVVVERPAVESRGPNPDEVASVESAPSNARSKLDLMPREAVSFETDTLPWERPRTERYRGTRFDGDWAPTDKSIQHGLAFRSGIASHLLGAVGALKEPCTRQERERMEDKCHGAQYRGDFEDAIEAGAR